MKKVNLKRENAITLIALIITIIIMLILAGVTLSMVLGDNGLINKAQSSVNEYQNASQKEEAVLDEIENYMGLHTPGSVVNKPEGWSSTVTAVSDGKGNVFPVPTDFYYVGGNFDNGVVISNDSADAYDGITDKTSYAYTTSLVGNQFVWIPCTVSEYKRTFTWNGKSQPYYGGYDTTSTSDATESELAQIEKYGGFYVARYEAGLASTITEFTGSQIQDGSSSPTGYNGTGTPQSKAGVVPWNYIDWTNSKANAESMYATASVASGLITGTQWDVMLNKFIGKTNENGLRLTAEDLTDSGKWGNYYNNGVTYTGRIAHYYNDGSWKMDAFKTATTGTITKDDIYAMTTGASKQTEMYHTYDVAGNMWEWTTEIGKGENYRVHRGGSYHDTSGVFPACCRNGGHTVGYVHCNLGFRVALYLK